MATTVNLRKGLDRKVAQMMTPCPGINAAGATVVQDPSGEENSVYYLQNPASYLSYRYRMLDDAWTELPASGVAGAFGAGTTGAYTRKGPSGTATAGTTTTLTTNLTLPRDMAGFKIRITAGPGAGDERTILRNTIGANSVITVTAPFSATITVASTYVLMTGQIWWFNAGTVAVGFSVYDKATNLWTAKSVTGLPTAWGTEGRLVAPFGDRTAAPFATGTATSATATTIVTTGKTWTASQWINSQVRITAGTGAGQVRNITANTADTLTVAAWTVTPDATSQYAIEGSDDFMYLLGNNAVTMYRYQISTNAWTTLAPGVARAAAMGAGGGANWICDADDPTWTNESAIKNGRYIYSFRGAASNLYDVYDIAANSWAAVAEYGFRAVTFTTGSCYDVDGRHIIISKEATGRIFKFDVVTATLQPWTTIIYPNGAATVGDKTFVWTYVDGATRIEFFYYLGHTLTTLMRVMDI